MTGHDETLAELFQRQRDRNARVFLLLRLPAEAARGKEAMPSSAAPDLTDLIARCRREQPDDRPTVAEVRKVLDACAGS